MWIQVPNDNKLFWICADSGMGKSAFAASLCDAFEKRQRLLGVFFCKYGTKSRSDGKSIIKSFAYQCSQALPECLESMREGAKLLNDVSI